MRSPPPRTAASANMISTSTSVVGSVLRPTSAASRDAPPGMTALPSRLTGRSPCLAAWVSGAWSCGVVGRILIGGVYAPEPAPPLVPPPVPPAPAPPPAPAELEPPPLLSPLELGVDVFAAIARPRTSRQSEYSSMSLRRWLRACRSSESVYEPCSTLSSSQSLMTVVGSAARAAGTMRRSVASRARKMVRRIGAITLAALRRGERARHRGRPRPLGVRLDGIMRGGAEAPAQRRVVMQAAQRGGERAGVAGGDDESGALVLDQAARG